MSRTPLAHRALTDDTAGRTLTAGAGFERAQQIGAGEPHWSFAAGEVLRWGVKTRSGFSIEGPSVVVAGARYWLVAQVGPLRIREPVQVLAVIDEPDRKGFAYGTLAGHPVRGEESFLVERRADGSVWLRLRSRTRAAGGWWRIAYPAVLVAQRVYRRRYFAALSSRETARG